MFPEYKVKAFQITLNSLNTTTSITIGANHNNLKTMQLLSELKITNNIPVHPKITFYFLLTLIFISILLFGM
jgi:hypothetical protein